MLHRSATIAPLLNPQGAKPLEGLEIHGPCSYCFDAACKSQVLHLNVKKTENNSTSSSSTARNNLLTTAPSHCKLVMPPTSTTTTGSSSSSQIASTDFHQKRSAGGGAGSASSANCFSTQLIALPIFTFQVMLETLQSEIDIEFILIDTTGQRHFLVVSTAVNQIAPKRMSNGSNEPLHVLRISYPHQVWSEFVVDIPEAFRLGYQLTQKQQAQHQEKLAASTTYVTNTTATTLQSLNVNKAKVAALNAAHHQQKNSLQHQIIIQAVQRVNFHAKGGPCKLRRVTAVASTFMSTNHNSVPADTQQQQQQQHFSPDINLVQHSSPSPSTSTSILVLPSALQFPSGVQFERVNWKSCVVLEKKQPIAASRKQSPENKIQQQQQQRAASATLVKNGNKMMNNNHHQNSSNTGRPFNFISVIPGGEKSAELSGLNNSSTTLTAGLHHRQSNTAKLGIKKPDILLLHNNNNKAPSISVSTNNNTHNTCRSTTTFLDEEEDALYSIPHPSHRNNLHHQNNNNNNPHLHAHFSELPPQHSSSKRQTMLHQRPSSSSNSGLINTPMSSQNYHHHHYDQNHHRQGLHMDPLQQEEESGENNNNNNNNKQLRARSSSGPPTTTSSTRRRTSSKIRTYLINDQRHRTIETTTTTTRTTKTKQTTTTTILGDAVEENDDDEVFPILIEDEQHDVIDGNEDALVEENGDDDGQSPQSRKNHDDIHHQAVQKCIATLTAPCLNAIVPNFTSANQNNQQQQLQRHIDVTNQKSKNLMMMSSRPHSAAASSSSRQVEVAMMTENHGFLTSSSSPVIKIPENSINNNNIIRPRTSGSIGPIRTSADSPKILHPNSGEKNFEVLKTGEENHEGNNNSLHDDDDDEEEEATSIVRRRLSTLDPIEIEKKIQENMIQKRKMHHQQQDHDRAEISIVDGTKDVMDLCSNPKPSSNNNNNNNNNNSNKSGIVNSLHVSPIKQAMPSLMNNNNISKKDNLLHHQRQQQPQIPGFDLTSSSLENDGDDDKEGDFDRDTMTEMLNDVSRVMSSRPVTSLPPPSSLSEQQKDTNKQQQMMKTQQFSSNNNNNNHYFQNLLQISAMTTSTTTMTATVKSQKQENRKLPSQHQRSAMAMQNTEEDDDELDDDNASSVARRLSLEQNHDRQKPPHKNLVAVHDEEIDQAIAPVLVFDNNFRSLSLGTPYVRRESRFPLLLPLHQMTENNNNTNDEEKEKIIQQWLNTKFQIKVGGPDRFISCFDEENSPRNERYQQQQQQKYETKNSLQMLVMNGEDEEIETRIGTAPHDDNDGEFSNFDLRKSVEELKMMMINEEEKMSAVKLDFSKMIWDPVICMFFDPQTNTFHFRK